jgi:hypothetical protein
MKIIALACLLAVLGTGVIGMRNGALAFAAPAVASLVWELVRRPERSLHPARVAFVLLVGVSACVLNLNYLRGETGKTTLVVAMVVAIVVLVGMDQITRRKYNHPVA